LKAVAAKLRVDMTAQEIPSAQGTGT
jgi:hypothetical protein